MSIDEAHDPLGFYPAKTKHRCSDNGFLAMTTEQYLELLAWTVERGKQPPSNCLGEAAPQSLSGLEITAESWCQLVSGFGKLFHLTAGRPAVVDEARSRRTHRRYRLSKEARALLTAAA